jgi:chromosome segregation ATPase
MKIISLLGEAEMGNKASLPIDRDLLYKARQKYPQYSGEQALTLYIADEMKEKDQVDSNQNRLLDTQKRENERLRSVVNDLGQTVEQELQQVAQQAEINDREISRIKQLTGKLSQGGTDTQRKAKVSGDDLEKLQKDLEMLKTKPGMDPEKYKKLQAQIKELVNNQSFDNTDLAKVRPLIATLNKQKNVGDELYQRLEDQLRKTQSELDKKENRFVKYIQKKTGEVGTMQKTHADEIANYANIVKGYEKQIKDFGNQMSGIEKQLAAVQKEKDITYQLRAGAQQDAQSVADMKDQISAKLELINNITNKHNSLIKCFTSGFVNKIILSIIS